MKISLVWVGKTTEDYLQKGIEIYTKRIIHYFPFEIISVPDIKNSKNMSFEQIKDLEGAYILKKTRAANINFILDEKGQKFDSISFSKFIQKKADNRQKQINFIIGGAYGFSEEVKNKAQGAISLSLLTFSHQLVRLVFMEQLYRACTIINNEPYHHA